MVFNCDAASPPSTRWMKMPDTSSQNIDLFGLLSPGRSFATTGKMVDSSGAASHRCRALSDCSRWTRALGGRHLGVSAPVSEQHAIGHLMSSLFIGQVGALMPSPGGVLFLGPFTSPPVLIGRYSISSSSHHPAKWPSCTVRPRSDEAASSYYR